MIFKIKKIPLYVKIFIGMLLGVLWLFVAEITGLQNFTEEWIAPFGKIFIKLLKLITVPLVFFSLVGGILNLKDISSLGKMGIKTMVIYVLMTFISVAIGFGYAEALGKRDYTTQESINHRKEYERWAIQNNIEIKGECITCDEEENVDKNLNQNNNSESNVPEYDNKLKSAKKGGKLDFIVDIVPENIFGAFSNNSKMLQIIFFAILFGISTLLVPNSKKILAPIFSGFNDVFIQMVNMIMKYSPYFVFCLIAGTLQGTDGENIGDVFTKLFKYVFIVLLGLTTMVLGVYPLVLRMYIGKYSYRDFFSKILPAQLMAFSTSSSAAALPVSMECARDLKIKPNVANFVLPIGSTVNMNGTSLFQGVTIIFLSQFYGIDLMFSEYLLIGVVILFASVGTASVPGSSLVLLMMVLSTANMNPEWIALIIPIERILDMARTVVNVTGDLVVAKLVNDKQNE